MPEDSAPIIVSAVFAPTDHAWLDGLRRAYFPPERNLIPAHLTLFHHLPPSGEAELRRRLRAATDGPAPATRAAGVMNLGRGVAIRIASPALEAVRADLAAAFHGLLTPQDAAGWRPHVTIQNKVDPADARRLLAELGDSFRERALVIRALSAWFYRGGPWEPIAEFPFSRR